ncbi:hypothetical protein APHAL10511_004025 [Amanita phalloides]|nr:hypothetical protein APHAL10511_004025 [Amanita phalloides]
MIIFQYILPTTVHGLEPGFKISDDKNPRPVGGISPRPIIALESSPFLVHTLDVTPDDLQYDVYLVPPDTKYRLPGMINRNDQYPVPSRPYPIPNDIRKFLRSSAVATTPSGVTILLIKRPDFPIYVRESRDPIICLSANTPESRVIYDTDNKKIKDWCQEVYFKPEVPHGMQRPNLDIYMQRCTFANLLHLSTCTGVNAADHQFVNVFEFVPNPGPRPCIGPGRPRPRPRPRPGPRPGPLPCPRP